MKGQYLTVEYLIFFMLGVFMIVSVYFTFSNMNEIYRNSTIQSQLRMTGELISGAVINVYEASASTNSTVNYTLPIPAKLSGCIYEINILDNNLNLNCSNVENGIALTLYNFNTTNRDIIYSTNGLINLYATNGTVELS